MAIASDSEFAGWRRAWLHGDVDPGLVAFVTRVAAACAATRTLPESLSPTGRWDQDSLADVVQGFWEKRLLPRTLDRAFDRVRTAGAFSRYLESSLRNWLIDEARGRGVPRVDLRLQALLREEDEFECHRPSVHPVDSHWGLAEPGWDRLAPFAGEDLALAAAFYAIGEVELLPPTQGERADPIISNIELKRIVSALFERVQAWLTPGQLAFVIRHRFPVYFPPAGGEETAEELQLAASEPAPAEAIDAETAARAAIAALSERQLAVLRGRLLENRTLEELAAEQACSRGTVDNEFKRATAILRQFASPEDIESVWKKIIELSS
jgi:RNA polymerase sigma factor (sigma-70 family)